MSHTPAPQPPPAFSRPRTNVLAAFLGQPPNPDPARRHAVWQVGKWRKIHGQGRSSFMDPETRRAFAVMCMLESPKKDEKNKKKETGDVRGQPILKAQLVLMRDKQAVAETLCVLTLEYRPDGSRPLIPDICQAIAHSLGIALHPAPP